MNLFKSGETPFLPLVKPTPASLRLGWGLLWIFYPFVLLADLMSLAGHPSGSTPSLMQSVLANTFLFGTMAYPVALLVCYVIWRGRNNSGRETSSLVCAFPLIYLLIPVLMMVALSNTQQRQSHRSITPANPSSLPSSRL